MKETIISTIGSKLIETVCSDLVDTGKNKAKAKINQILQESALQEFRKKLDKNILEKYGQEQFYDDLCRALLQGDNLGKLLTRCKDRPLTDYDTDDKVINHIMTDLHMNVYNMSRVREVVYYIGEMAFLSFNQLADPENIILKNIMKKEEDVTRQRIAGVKMDTEKISATLEDLREEVREGFQGIKEMNLQNSAEKMIIEETGNLTPEDIRLIKSGQYDVKVAAKEQKDYFRVSAEVKISPKDFHFESFQEYISYLRFAGKEVALHVCRFLITSADGNEIKNYEDISYKGMKISLPDVFVKEVELGNIKFSKMMVHIKPQFDYEEFQVENEEGEIIIPNRKYKIEREYCDGNLCIHFLDNHNSNRLQVDYCITVYEQQPLRVKTGFSITQRDTTSVSCNLEFYKLFNKIKKEKSLIARKLVNDNVIFQANGILSIDPDLLDLLDEKIRFFINLSKLERLYKLRFSVPDIIEQDEIMTANQIVELLELGIVRTPQDEMTVNNNQFDLISDTELENLISAKKSVLIFHYQKISIFDTEIPVSDCFKVVNFIENVSKGDDGEMKMFCYSGFIYNEQLATLSEDQILNNLANGKMLICDNKIER